MAMIAADNAPSALTGKPIAECVPRPSFGKTTETVRRPAMQDTDQAIDRASEQAIDQAIRQSVDQPIEHVLPLSGCILRVRELPDGERFGQLFAVDGRWLAEARCELVPQVTGWFGRTHTGTPWALAFGAGGIHESIDVRFASLRSRCVVPVMSDHYGLWVAEVTGAYRAATIHSPTTTTTFRLHSAAA